MGKTPIEWVAGDDGSAGFTINPFRAKNLETGRLGHFCVKVSPGCKNCYASRLQPRMGLFPFLVENRPKVELVFDEKPLKELMRRKKPTRVFPFDMSDAFMEDYPDEWLDRCFAYFALMPEHKFYVLTKRAERMRSYWRYTPGTRDAATRIIGLMEEIAGDEFAWRFDGIPDFPLYNLRLGVSVEDRKRADERFPIISELGEADWNTFVSMEPLLEEVAIPKRYLDLGARAWIILGGESGSNSRPFNLDWARTAISQCQASGVPCFVKQIGSNSVWPPETISNGIICGYNPISDRKGGDPSEWPEWMRVRQFADRLENA